MDIEMASKSTPVKVEDEHKLSWEKVSWEIDVRSMNPLDRTVQVKKVLDNVSGEVSSSQFLAILGPSGCGKTSLLDLLGNRSSSGRLTGNILIDNEPMPSNFYASYVAQEDSLLGSFTTKETLLYSAALTLDFRQGYQERLKIVSNLLHDLGLESCADTKVGDIFFKGLSGGQKRRLSLGIGLISRPKILLLDEPTSGLDAASAYEIIQLLTNLCTKKGLCIVATLHQPSSDIYGLFSKLMLLSNGKQIYFGNSDEAVGYFTSIGYSCPEEFNPADYFLGLINTDFPNHVDITKLQAEYQAKMSNYLIPSTITSAAKINSYRNPNPSLWHMIVLTHRFFLNSFRNVGILGVRIAMYTMLAVAIGGEFYKTGDKSTNTAIQGTIACIFYVFAFMIFMAVAVIPFYMMDSFLQPLQLPYVKNLSIVPIQFRVTYQREQLNGDYKAFAFVAANLIASIPGIFLIALFSTIPIVLLMKLKNFGWFLLLLFLSLICSEGLMAVVSAVSPHFIIGIAGSAGLFGFFMLCEGFFQIKSQIPGWFIWVYYMGFHTYAFRGAIVNEFGNRGVLKDAVNPHWKTGHDVLVYLNMDNVQKGDDAWTLLGYAMAWHVVYYFIVSMQTGKRKSA